MKVKIGDKIYNSFHEPIMIILTNKEKELISQMEDTLFCSYPDETKEEDINKFMGICKEKTTEDS